MRKGRPDFLQIKMTGSSELDILGCLFLCYFLFGQAKESMKILNSLQISTFCKAERLLPEYYLQNALSI
ncbi:TPA: hypothetical protein DCR49_01180 [Candidatus Delongbacteria bacterium]|nr:hypothetical protein [Candidatus Delongbacteria bacterium]